MSFVHLHNHTTFSTLDGTQKMGPMLDAMLADGQPAAAITDHGTMSGAWRFATAAKAAGVKPILGIEAYLSLGSRFERNAMEVPAEDDFDGSAATESSGATKTKRYEHLTMLAATHQGWRNLVRMTNESEDSYWYKPRLDYDLMARSHPVTGEPLTKGIIVGTGCLGGPVAGPLLRDDLPTATANLRRLIDLYGAENVFAEVMDHGIPAERKVLGGIVELARQHGLRVVATNDCHYTHADEAGAHDAWLCVSQKKRNQTVTVDDTDRFRFNGTGYHLRTAAEMHAIFDGQPGTESAVSNSLVIAEMCEPDVIGQTRTRLPRFPVPDVTTEWTLGQHTVTVEPQPDASALLYQLVKAGAVLRYGTPLPAPVKARLRREKDVIDHFGYADYFLIKYDAISWARSDRGLPTKEHPRGVPGQKRPIVVGPGRGSAAGSMTAYVLWVTNIEPLSNNLLFERFLDTSRFDFPDIDTDFESSRRDDVVTYLEHRWGHDIVARLGTFSVAWAKRAVKDVARVTKRTPLANQVTPLIHIKGKPEDTPLETLLHDPEYTMADDLRALVRADPDVADLVTMARSVEGVVAGESIHACGVVLGDEPLPDLIPLRYDRRKDRPGDEWVTSWDAKDAEKFGLVKFDFLSLKDLDVVSAALASIEATTGERVDTDNLPMGAGVYANEAVTDPGVVERDNERARKAWALLGAGKTAGVFQLAGSGITELTRSIRPESLDDIAAICALYRPGPMGSGEHEKFARRRRGGERADYTQWTRDPAETEVIASVIGSTLACIARGSRVWSVSRNLWVPIEDIRVGELVQGVDESGRHVARQVTDTAFKGVRKTVRVTFHTGQSIRLTPDHLLLSADGWKHAGELTSQDSVAAPYELLSSGLGNEVSRARISAYLAETGESETASFLDGSRWLSVVSVVEEHEEEVFDITVDGIHNFVVEGIVAHNCITFQEQLMLLAQRICDFSDVERNKLRKAFAKKDKLEMARLYDRFVEGGMRDYRVEWLSDGKGSMFPRCDETGREVAVESKVAFRKETLTSLWRTFEASAEYLFNSSHAYAYGYVSYITAFLKANWPEHYGAALLANVPMTKVVKRHATLVSLRSEGVDVLPPSVNLSGFTTGVDANGAVRIGLSEVAGGGENLRWVIHERDRGGPFTSLHDLLTRVRLPQSPENVAVLTKKLPVSTLDALAEAGALDEFGVADTGQPSRLGIRMVLRAAAASPDVRIPAFEWGVEERSMRERHRLGIVLSQSPLSALRSQIATWREPGLRGGRPMPVHLIERADKANVVTIGVVSRFTKKAISSGEMYDFTLEGSSSSIDCVAWPTTVRRLAAAGKVPVLGAIVGVTARTRLYTPPVDDDADGTGDDAVEPEQVLSLVVNDLWVGDLDDPATGALDAVAQPIRAELEAEPAEVPGTDDEPSDVVEVDVDDVVDVDDATSPAQQESVMHVTVGRCRTLPGLTSQFRDVCTALPGLSARRAEFEEFMSQAGAGDEFDELVTADGRTTVVFVKGGSKDTNALKMLAALGQSVV